LVGFLYIYADMCLMTRLDGLTACPRAASTAAGNDTATLRARRPKTELSDSQLWVNI